MKGKRLYLLIGGLALIGLLFGSRWYMAGRLCRTVTDTVIMDRDTVLFSRQLGKRPAATADLYTLYKLYHLASGAYKVHQALNVTDEELADYMRQSMKAEDAQNRVCGSTSRYTMRLKKITRGMTRVGGKQLNFKVYQDSETANAFASPDGSVRVYSKLMDIMSDEEILGILGHELGHIACQHSLKQYKAALLVSAAREGLLADDGTLGDLAASQLGGVVEYMLNAKFSRTQESEADNYGYDYLVSLHRNPMAIADGLHELEKLSAQGSGYARYVNTLFSTHPDISSRVASLKARARKDGYN